MNKETNTYGWPEFKIISPVNHLKAVGRALGDFLIHRHFETEEPNMGAAVLLDSYLDEETRMEKYWGPVLEHVVEIPEETQLMLDYGTLEL